MGKGFVDLLVCLCGSWEDLVLAEKGNEIILVADPDLSVQSVLTKLFSDDHAVTCFSDSGTATQFLKDYPNTAIVFSCYHLPGGGGVAFLKECEALAPQAARIMLTGESSKNAVKEALNLGHAFMYLEKSCQRNEILAAFEAALSHHRHLAKERAILERTLAGSVKMLIEMLSLFHPEAFRRTSAIRQQALKIAKQLGLKKTWELEMAVMLSPLGEAMLPTQILSKFRAARSLGEQEREILARAPQQTRDLLQNIPQLNRVSEYLFLSGRGYDGSGFPENGPIGQDIPLISRIIKLLTDLWYASPENGPDAAAFEALLINRRQYDPRLLEITKAVLLKELPHDPKSKFIQCHIRSLKPGDVLVDDVRTETSFELVLSGGHLLTPTTIRRLENFNKTAGVRQPLRVRRSKTAGSPLEKSA